MRKMSVGLLIMLTPVLLQAQEVVRVNNGVLAVANGGVLMVAGGVTLTDGSELSNEGSITLRPNDSLSGVVRWDDRTVVPYHYGTGEVAFSGPVALSVSSGNIFGRIIVDNNGLDLERDISASSWYLRSGLVRTNGYKAIALSASQRALEADSGNTGYRLGVWNIWISPLIRKK